MGLRTILGRVAGAMGLAVLMLGALSAPAEAQVLPVEEFARRPALAHVSLSPSGRYLAYVAQDDTNATLAVRDLQTGVTRTLWRGLYRVG